MSAVATPVVAEAPGGRLGCRRYGRPALQRCARIWRMARLSLHIITRAAPPGSGAPRAIYTREEEACSPSRAKNGVVQWRACSSARFARKAR